MAIPSDGARGGAPEPYQNKMFTYGPSAERRKAKQPYIWSYRWFRRGHTRNYLTPRPEGSKLLGLGPDCVNFRTSHMDDYIDDLDTSTGPRLLGNVPRQLFIEHARDLTEADIAALATNRGTKPKSLVRIHASHHSLAKCLATGMKQSQAALVTGYNQSRISVLLQDAAFAALVEDYRAEAKSIFADLAERMNNMSLDAIELLQERLHDNPETFSIPLLIDVVKTFADRTGHGPGQEVTLKMDRDFIDRPPRENFDQWKERRAKELGAGSQEASEVVHDPKELN